MYDITKLLPHLTLRFNIEHPSLEECYAYGYECAHAEVSEEENPYSIGSKESEQWLEGWWDGFYGEKPLYELTDGNITIQGLAEKDEVKAANDLVYGDHFADFFITVLEITGIIAVSAVVGYQLIDLVA